MKAKKKVSLRQRFALLRQASRLQRDAEHLEEEVREAEGANCMYCGEWRTWKELTDESTQTKHSLICSKCISRRQVAHASGWANWPERD